MEKKFPGLIETGRSVVTVRLGSYGTTRKLAEIEEELYYDLYEIAQAMGEDEIPHIEAAINAKLNQHQSAVAPAHQSALATGRHRASGAGLRLCDSPRLA
jgi:hypothetical protein